MAIVHQKCKKTGTVYAYENTAYWDKEKKQSRAKRKLIGKIDPNTGKIVPTRAYRKKQDTTTSPQTQTASSPEDVAQYTRKFCGVNHLLSQIGKQLGITQDLKAIFPNDYKQIQSVAQYLILEENPLHVVP